MRRRRQARVTLGPVVAALATWLFALDADPAPSSTDFAPPTCPTCPVPPQYADVISLSAGGELTGRMVAENEAFYVIELYGQILAVSKSRVADVSFSSGRPGDLSQGDHILLRNGHVLVGSIAEDNNEFGYFRFASRLGNQSEFIVFKSQIASVHRNGKPHGFEAVPLFDYKLGDKFRSL